MEEDKDKAPMTRDDKIFIFCCIAYIFYYGWIKEW